MQRKPANLKKVADLPFDVMMMFKTLILHCIYNLSDEQLEYQINDRRSFTLCFGLKNSDKGPDGPTFCTFSEALIKEELIEKLFEIFNTTLNEKGINVNF
ncbi:MAG: transposase [Bacteroidota bacterium]|nr:transposase [Bacteroidota bacterium]